MSAAPDRYPVQSFVFARPRTGTAAGGDAAATGIEDTAVTLSNITVDTPNNSKVLTASPAAVGGKTAEQMSFDGIVSDAASPQHAAEQYQNIVNSRIKLVAEGRNVCFMSFGHSSSGKTHHLYGAAVASLFSHASSSSSSSSVSSVAGAASAPAPSVCVAIGGLCHELLVALLSLRQASSSTGSALAVGMYEVTSERIFDLLDVAPAAAHPSSSSSSATPSSVADLFVEKKLSVLPNGTSCVEGLALREVVDISSFNDVVGRALAIRASVLPTSSSSHAHHLIHHNSHTVLQFHFSRKEPGMIFRSVVSLVELVATDRARAIENASVKRDDKGPLSMITLRKCFDSLIEAAKAKRHAGVATAMYRQSILTALLSDIFVGNGVLTVVGCFAQQQKQHHHPSSVESSIVTLRFCHAIRAVSFAAKVNAERVAGAVTEMRHEVEELKRKLEAEKLAREQDNESRAHEVSDMEARRQRLEAEQRAKKALNAKALASISKQMRTLQTLQSQLAERQKLHSDTTATKQQKRAVEEESTRLQQQLQREAELAAMREQEAILQRQIALQLEAQQAVQSKMRETAEKNRLDLLGREMSFVFRAAAQRTKDEADTNTLRAEVEELKRQLDDAVHEDVCKKANIAALEAHVAAVEAQYAYLDERHTVMDTLLNDGIEARAKDIRDSQRCLEATEERLRAVEQSRAAVAVERDRLARRMEAQDRDDAALLGRLRAERDSKRQVLAALEAKNTELVARRSEAQSAAARAKRDADRAEEQVREAELGNARKRQEESIYGEQLADVLRAITASRKRSNQLDGMISSIQVQLNDTQTRFDKSNESREAFEAFLAEHRQHATTTTPTHHQHHQKTTADLSIAVAAVPTLESPARLSRQSTPVLTDGALRAAKRISIAVNAGKS